MPNITMIRTINNPNERAMRLNRLWAIMNKKALPDDSPKFKSDNATKQPARGQHKQQDTHQAS